MDLLFEDTQIALDGTQTSPPKVIYKREVPRVEITLEHVSLDVPTRSCCKNGRVRLLNNIDAVFKPGELVALMGGSGAGKSTLLNLIANRFNGELSGDILCNGQRRSNAFDNVSAYVMQVDLMQPLLTVREQVYLTAKKRLPRSWTAEQRQEATEELLNRLNIALCGDTRIGGGEFKKGISGGELKRTNVATELITNPSVCFLDEPTSGLDAVTAARLVTFLRSLAAEGRTLICTIHQPSVEVFHMFDKLLLLSKPGDGTGGNLAYYGPVSEAETFFAHCGFPCPPKANPADYFLQVVTPVVVRHPDTGQLETINQTDIQRVIETFNLSRRAELHRSIDLMKSSHDLSAPAIKPPAEEFDISQEKRISYFAEFAVLMHESFLVFWRNPRFSRFRLVQTIFLALLCGFVYLQLPLTQSGLTNRQGVTFFMTTNTFISSMFSVLNVFPSNRKIFLREHASNAYHSFPYWLAKSTMNAPADAISAIIYSSIAYFMVGLQASKFGIFLITVILNYQAAASVGMFVSSGVETQQMAMNLAAPVLIPLLLFGGFFLAPGTGAVWLNWIRWISPFNYCFPNLFYNELQGLTFTCNPGEFVTIPPSLGCNITQFCPFTSGQQYLAYTGFSDVNIIFNLGMLGVLTVGYRLLSYLIFWASIRRVTW